MSRTRLEALALVGLAVVTRLPGLLGAPLSPDEATLVHYGTWPSLLADLPHHPLLFRLPTFLVQQLTWTPGWLRLPSFVAGVAAPLVLWAGLRRERGLASGGAFAAALLLVLSTPQIGFAALARGYAPAVLLAAAAVGVALAAARRPSIGRFAALAVVLSLLSWTAWTGLVVAGALLAGLALAPGERHRARLLGALAVGVALGAALLPALPALVEGVRHYHGAAMTPSGEGPGPLGVVLALLPRDPPEALPVAGLVVWGVVRRRPLGQPVLVVALVAAAALAGTLALLVYQRGDHAAVAAPVLFAFAGAALADLWRARADHPPWPSAARPGLRRAAAVAAVALLALHAAVDRVALVAPWPPFASRAETGVVDFLRDVRQTGEADPRVLVAPGAWRTPALLAWIRFDRDAWAAVTRCGPGDECLRTPDGAVFLEPLDHGRLGTPVVDLLAGAPFWYVEVGAYTVGARLPDAARDRFCRPVQTFQRNTLYRCAPDLR